MSEEVYKFDEEFRDSIATVDQKGKRVWIYPKKPSGRYHMRRVQVSIALLVLFFAGPWIQIGDRPLLLLDILNRHFVVFGKSFWPQDFMLLAVLLITFFVFIILFTVVFGRIWCGWMCPQTIFMEMVFRKIEYWIEGDAPAQRRLARSPWNFKKVLKKTLKQGSFITVSLAISHTVMAYVIGSTGTFEVIRHSPAAHPGGFIGLMSFTGIFYGVFAGFREQACTAICPYGRLQDVLLMKNSIVVAYDWLRGEPRTHLKKKGTQEKKGDCVDCKLCVHVCPTGIDIRNGTQLECVNCTACMDACDQVMARIGRPAGLIRYASYNGIKEGAKRIFTSRVVAYSFVLIALLGVLGTALITRTDVETTILKVPGTLYQRSGDGYISNLYQVEFVNKTFEDLTVDAKVRTPSSAVIQKAEGPAMVVPAEGLLKRLLFIKIPADRLTSARTTVTIDLYHGADRIDAVKIKFIGPVSRPSDVKSRLEDKRNERDEHEQDEH